MQLRYESGVITLLRACQAGEEAELSADHRRATPIGYRPNTSVAATQGAVQPMYCELAKAQQHVRINSFSLTLHSHHRWKGILHCPPRIAHRSVDPVFEPLVSGTVSMRRTDRADFGLNRASRVLRERQRQPSAG